MFKYNDFYVFSVIFLWVSFNLFTMTVMFDCDNEDGRGNN